MLAQLGSDLGLGFGDPFGRLSLYSGNFSRGLSLDHGHLLFMELGLLPRPFFGLSPSFGFGGDLVFCAGNRLGPGLKSLQRIGLADVLLTWFEEQRFGELHGDAVDPAVEIVDAADTANTVEECGIERPV